MCGSFEDFVFVLVTSLHVNCKTRPQENPVDMLSSNLGVFSKDMNEDIFVYFEKLSELSNFFSAMKGVDINELVEQQESDFQEHTSAEIQAKLSELKSETKLLDIMLSQLDGCDFTLCEEFLKNLQVIHSQPEDEEYEKLIKKELQVFCCTSQLSTDTVYDEFQQIMKKWFEETGYTNWLCKQSFSWETMQEHINEKVTHISREAVEEIETLGITFKNCQIQNLSKLLEENSVLNIITHRTMLTKLKVLQILQFQGYNNPLVITLKSALILHKSFLSLWPNKWNSVLVLECKEYVSNTAELAQSFSEIVLGSEHKLILITQKECENFAQQMQNCKFYKECLDDCKVFHLSNKSQQTLLAKKINFQGQQVCLGSLINNTFCLQNYIDSEDLYNLLCNEVTIGNILTCSDSHYVPRNLEHRVYMKKDIFWETSGVFAVTGVTAQELALLVPPGKEICTFEFDDGPHFISHHVMMNGNRHPHCDDGNNSDLPVQLVNHNTFSVARLVLKQICTYIKPDHCNFIILNNKNPEADFTELSKLCENLHWIHIRNGSLVWMQSSGRNFTIIQNHKVACQFDTYDEKTMKLQDSIILCGKSGMGKSTFLNHILKKLDPSVWTVKIDLAEHIQTVEQIDTIEKCKKFLWNTLHLGNSIKLAEVIFNYSVEILKNIVVVVEKYDEVHPKYKKNVDFFIHTLHKSLKLKVWVTCQSSVCEDLERKMSKLAFKLQAFTQDDQIEVWIHQWRKTLKDVEDMKMYDYSKHLLEVLTRNLGEDLKIPLLIMMVGEVFLQDAENYFNTGRLWFPNTFNLLTLFKKFVGTKCTESGAALLMLFSSDYLKQYMKDEDLCALELERDNLEILEGKLQFAEYSAASWLANNHAKCKTLIESKLVGDYCLMMQLFDHMLAKGNRLHEAVLNNDDIALSQLLTSGVDVNSLDRGGRTALHLAVIYNRPLISVLLSTPGVSVNVTDNILDWTPQCYSVHMGFWHATECLLQKNAILSTSFGQRDYNTGGLEIIRTGYTRLVGMLLDSGIDINKPLADMYPLHVATILQDETMIQYLLDQGANVNLQDVRGMSAFHKAVNTSKDNLSIIQLMISRGASVTAQDNSGNTALLYAVKRNNLDVARFLIENGTPVNVNDEDGFTALMLACCGNLAMVELLLESGAPVNIRTRYRLSPLQIAAEGGHVEIALLLIKKGANINYVPKIGEGSALQIAVYKGHVQMVRCLLDNGAEVYDALMYRYPFTVVAMDILSLQSLLPLEIAVEREHLDVVRLLIEHGADVGYGAALICAIDKGNFSILEYLLQSGADVHELEFSYMQAAIEKGDVRIVRMLVQYGCSVDKAKTPLHIAAFLKNIEMAEYLIQVGVEMKSFKYLSMPVLHCACIYEETVSKLFETFPQATFSTDTFPNAMPRDKTLVLEMVKLLITNGAEVNAIDEKDRTPLHVAVISGIVDVVKYLVQNGADVNRGDILGSTPLHYATLTKNVEMMQCVIDAGAKVDARNKMSRTSLCIAAHPCETNFGLIPSTEDNSEVVKCLIDNGANVNGTEKHIPLITAVTHFSTSTVGLLIENGCDVNKKDDRGSSPLHFAALWGHLEIVKLLVEAGAKLDARDLRGYTPLIYALKSKAPVNDVAMGMGCVKNIGTPNHKGVINYLAEKGVNLNMAEYMQGLTPLMLCICSNDIVCLKLLIELGADINLSGKPDNPYPLVLAMNRNLTNIVHYLVEHGANVNAQSSHGDTALHLAVQADKKEYARYLVDNGADVNIVNSEGVSPMDMIRQKQSLGEEW